MSHDFWEEIYIYIATFISPNKYFSQSGGVYSCERELVLQQSQIFFLSFNLAAADKQDERRHAPVGRFQSLDVFRAEYRRNDGNQMAALEQRQIHEQPCYSTVAVNKRMDGHKPLMKASCVFDRMVLFPPSRSLFHEFLYESRNFFGTRKLVGRACHKDTAFSVDTGLFFLNLAEEQFVQSEDILLGESRASLE